MRQPVRTIVKILIASLIVGLILKGFDIEPMSLLRGLGGFAQRVIDVFSGILEWSLAPILVGAVVVVPIWVIWFVWKKTFDKSGTR
jgi:hypothetical protein